MTFRGSLGAVLVLLAMLAAAYGQEKLTFRGELSRPEAAGVDLSDATLGEFDVLSRHALFRYLAGNPRWEIRRERGKVYAVRLEEEDGKYAPTLNGFYTRNSDGAWRQTRVLLAFGKPHGFGRDTRKITRLAPGTAEARLKLEGEHTGSPGFNSYLIVPGDDVFLEIFEQDPGQARPFTQQAYNDVSSELRDVLAHQAVVMETGILPVPERYPVPLPEKPFLEVGDGMQPGIFQIRAGIAPAKSGVAYLKAFDVKSGRQLSAARMTPRSTRYVGWSKDGKTVFPYTSEVTVYEGDWKNEYEARFELWHRADDGTETKLLETTRMIHGWEH